MNAHQELTRQELYDLVWSTAMTNLAKKFGISDVGLRKICVKHAIPTPPPGYWAKLQYGKNVAKAALPVPTAGIRDRIRVSIYAVQQSPDVVVAAQLAAHKKFPDPIEVPIELPSRPHRLASTTMKALKSAKADHEGFLKTKSTPGVVFSQIGAPSIKRVSLILDSIARTLEHLGHEITDAENGVDFVLDGEKLRLSFHETKDKFEHHPTAAELAEKARWEGYQKQWPTLYRSDKRHWRSWDYSPSGRISLTLEASAWTSWSSDRLLGRWHDRKSARVEQQLNDVIVAMHAGAALLRHNRAAIEERKRLQQQEAERRQRDRDRQDRITKREAFVRQKSKEYRELSELRGFSEYLSREPLLGLTHASAIAAVTRELVDRLEHSLSASVLDREVVGQALYADDELPRSE